MEKEFGHIIRLRFDENNRKLIENFTKVKERLNARGLLNSTETIKEIYKALETEFIGCVGLIVITAIDVARKDNLLVKRNKIQKLCEETLAARKQEIEGIYLSNTQQIRGGLLNSNMLSPFMSLDKSHPLQREEIVIRLSNEIDKYHKENGNNLRNIIQNRFLNTPIVAWGAIVIFVIIVIASFTNALSNLMNLFNN
jgi:DNA integrity scanning protein DisA with diadenylate cyclase activity